MILNFIIPYRAIDNQSFRKKELSDLLININNIMQINNTLTTNTYIIEQNNNQLFNMGLLKNIGFYQAYNLYDTIFHNKNTIIDDIFIHCNTDFALPVSKLPEIFYKTPTSFIDIHGFSNKTLGAFCLFNSYDYIKCNGFPNDIWGWGGEDWAIYNRICAVNLDIVRPTNLYNKWIIEKHNHIRDQSYNKKNMKQARNLSDIFNNGLNTCKFIINDIKHIQYDYNNVFWYKVNF